MTWDQKIPFYPPVKLQLREPCYDYSMGTSLGHYKNYNFNTIEWKDNLVFDDTLRFEYIHHNNSSIAVRMYALNMDYSLYVFENTFVWLLHNAPSRRIQALDKQNNLCVRLAFDGRFTFAKKGQNHGVIIAP